MIGAFGPSNAPEADLRLFAPGGFFLLEALRLGRRRPSRASFGGSRRRRVLVLGRRARSARHGHGTASPLSGVAVRSGRRSGPAMAGFPGPVGHGVVLAQALVATCAADSGSPSVRRSRRASAAPSTSATPDLCQWRHRGIGRGARPRRGYRSQDLARVAILRDGAPAGTAITGCPCKRCRSNPYGRVLGSWLGPVLASAVAIVAGAAWVTGLLDVGRPSAWRIAGVAFMHQATVFALCALRVRWLAVSLDLVDAPPDRSSRRLNRPSPRRPATAWRYTCA